MSSFISNSKKGLITRSIITMILLLTAYGFIVPRLFPNGGDEQNQWQGNIIKSQKYLYNKDDSPYVIVGSSLSAKLSSPSLPNEYYNLSLSGGSLLTGLELVLRSDKTPKVVLVETNVLTLAPDDKFVDSFFNPVMHLIRTYMPFLKDQFQPIVLSIHISRKLLTSVGLYSTNDSGVKKQLDSILDIGLKRQQADYSKPPDKRILHKRVERLKHSVTSLQNRGVQVIFFEIPVHPILYNTPKILLERESLLSAFPDNQFAWIPFPDPTEYRTVDGIHLSEESARKYATFLMFELQRIMDKERSL